MAMIYGYYDRNGKWNLIPWTATWASNTPSNFDSAIKTLITSIRNYMSWYYTFNWKIYETSVDKANFPKWIEYAKKNWYPNSTAVYSTWTISTLFSKIKSEINANKPIILHLSSIIKWLKNMTCCCLIWI